MEKQLELATFAAGCFWCVEAIFQEVKGVKKVVSGYSGGRLKNPSYEQVSSGISGHAESIQVTFDPKIISYEDLLYIFWRVHDPTTKDRQGADVGPQYRSVIFYHNQDQEQKAKASRDLAQALFDSPIVTSLEPFQIFYTAEAYHQNYYNDNKNAPYCQLVIDPKLKKLKEEYKKYLK